MYFVGVPLIALINLISVRVDPLSANIITEFLSPLLSELKSIIVTPLEADLSNVLVDKIHVPKLFVYSKRIIKSFGKSEKVINSSPLTFSIP